MATPMGTIRVMLKEPYWGAWKKYGWDYGTPAYSLKESTVKNAIVCENDIVVEYKGVKYKLDIEGFRAWYKDQTVKPIHITRGTRLICTPKFLYTEL